MYFFYADIATHLFEIREAFSNIFIEVKNKPEKYKLSPEMTKAIEHLVELSKVVLESAFQYHLKIMHAELTAVCKKIEEQKNNDWTRTSGICRKTSAMIESENGPFSVDIMSLLKVIEENSSP